jgi:hypothetical protein
MKAIKEFYSILCTALWATQLTRSGKWRQAHKLMLR